MRVERRGTVAAMYDFVSHVLRRYFEATGWNERCSYLYLNAASAALLDFPTPPGVAFSISASPCAPFFTTYRLRTLPSLQGNVGYLFSSTDLDNGGQLDIGQSSGRVGLKRIVERFRVPPLPHAPSWSERKPGQKRDYLLYGCMHIPSSRVDALYTIRLAPTWQAILSASSTPPKVPFAQQLAQLSGLSDEYGSGGAAGGVYVPNPKPTPTNLQILLQRDTGRLCTEYSYSVDDGLWGFRCLHHFGKQHSVVAVNAAEEPLPTSEAAAGGVGSGLRGTFSAGAEVFFSSLEKSAGLSTGVRFATLPEGDEKDEDAHPPSQTPTIITATLNPMMGHLSTSYAARMARDVAACSRFDFNVYSYESELTLGFEYWLRAGSAPTFNLLPAAASSAAAAEEQWGLQMEENEPRILVPTQADWSLRETRVPPLDATETTTPPVSAGEALRPTPSPSPTFSSPAAAAAHAATRAPDDLIGLLKARISSTTDISLMWEGRLRSSLVSVGCRANLGNRTRPISSIGIEILYFSSASDAAAQQQQHASLDETVRRTGTQPAAFKHNDSAPGAAESIRM